ncbi:hypothetical protein N9L68_09180, partial [bacterium]|nr:hypothetical protein [bacterium]
KLGQAVGTGRADALRKLIVPIVNCADTDEPDRLEALASACFADAPRVLCITTFGIRDFDAPPLHHTVKTTSLRWNNCLAYWGMTSSCRS